MLLAINTDPARAQQAWAIVKRGIQEYADRFQCIYSTDPDQVGHVLEIEERHVAGGVAKVVQLQVPAAGFVIYEGF